MEDDMSTDYFARFVAFMAMCAIEVDWAIEAEGWWALPYWVFAAFFATFAYMNWRDSNASTDRSS
jgi:Ni,Fe-hydrogenase I cytochrome b subunit